MKRFARTEGTPSRPFANVARAESGAKSSRARARSRAYASGQSGRAAAAA